MPGILPDRPLKSTGQHQLNGVETSADMHPGVYPGQIIRGRDAFGKSRVYGRRADRNAGNSRYKTCSPVEIPSGLQIVAIELRPALPPTISNSGVDKIGLPGFGGKRIPDRRRDGN